ncbi:HypC/HybG/HupF family hydrogenase formation chaperone [Azotosporobacter soli]|uniref:HypC/HybG/HupF family hydrogenase formation chaperone n=1 Tax=Azotosporobacter soli TaxID=3055040 RepID=UPI0031FF325F
MCLAIPGRIVERKEYMATLEINGVRREASLMLLPEAQVGDFVLLHAGFAVQRINEQEAEETLALWRELENHADVDG